MIFLKKYLAWVCTYALACAVVACSGDHISWKKDASGLEYVLVKTTGDTCRAVPGDVVDLSFDYRNVQDSVLFSTQMLGGRLRMEMREASYQGGCFEDALALLGQGDSIVFRLEAGDFFEHTQRQPLPDGIGAHDWIIVRLKLLHITQKKEYELQLAERRKRKAHEEELVLQRYLSEKQLTVEPEISGLYMVKLTQGKGPRVVPGDVVEVHYTAMFLDGMIFDSSAQRDKPFEFKLGAADVIPGWEEAVAKMNVGGKATIIVPSHLAYGAQGYGNLIPPFAPLIFDIEVLRVFKE